jgi:signal transduction histidine kinase
MSFFVSLSTNPKIFYWSLFTQTTFIFGILVFNFDNFIFVPVIFLYLAYISAVTSALLILWRLFCQFRLLSTTSTSVPTNSSESFEDYIYIFCLTFNIFGRFLIYFVTLASANMAQGYQSSLYNCVDIFTVLIIISVGGRKTREDYCLSQIRLAKKKAFVKYISHEIRTPLNTISLGTKYLLDNLESLRSPSQANELLEALEDIQESSDVAICTLNNILTFETLDAGELTLIPKETSPKEFIISTLKMFKIQASQAGITLIYECCPSLDNFFSMIDPNKMGQVLRNLVSNALKFTKSGGTVIVRAYHKVETVYIERSSPISYSSSCVQPEENEDFLVFEVEDTGIGMSEVGHLHSRISLIRISFRLIPRNYLLAPFNLMRMSRIATDLGLG